jgi:NADH-quinone oxidoreductase subunit M
MSVLLLLFIVPLIASGITLLYPSKRIAFVLSLIPLAILTLNQHNWPHEGVNYAWFPSIGVHFHLAVDTVSLLFLYLSAVIVPLSILVSTASPMYCLILLLQAFLVGFFTAQDLAMFTIFWEAMLLPLYFIINQWGSGNKVNASFKFLIYMIAGSALMVAAVLALYFAANGTFDLKALASVSEQAPFALAIFFVFMLAFAVKTPLFPFHAWLPDSYTQAPLAGTILLSAILSKAGIYGVYRIGLGLFPHFIESWSPLLLGLAIAGVFYGGLSAWMQNDYKRLIAYSSFSHVNFVLAGLFVMSETAHAGAILQALNHGITIAGLFLVAGWLEERLQTTQLGQVTGLAKYMPNLCWLTLFFVMASVALPGTNNFVGEILIFFGLFVKDPIATAVLALSVILSVMYMLRFMQKTYFETPSPQQSSWVDIHGREMLIALPLALLILWIGIYPAPILRQLLGA